MTNTPLLTVIVPARNEENVIETCIRSIFLQDYSNLEIIVIDDHSSDQTPLILRRLSLEDARLKIIDGRPLPKGWTGKNNAIAHGVTLARGDYFIFVDADVSLHPNTISSSLQALQTYQAVFLSVWPKHRLKTFWEQVVQPVVVSMNIALNSVQRLFRRPFPEAFFAWGGYLLIQRKAYEIIGGHASVASEVAEDFMLQQKFQQSGYRTIMMDASNYIDVRMYDSFFGLWEGWSKNIFQGLMRSYVLTLLAAIGIFVFTILPGLICIYALLLGQSLVVLLSLVMLAFLGIAAWCLRSHLTLLFPVLALNPVGGAIFIAILFNSAWRQTFNKGVTWKGRRYD